MDTSEAYSNSIKINKYLAVCIKPTGDETVEFEAVNNVDSIWFNAKKAMFEKYGHKSVSIYRRIASQIQSGD